MTNYRTYLALVLLAIPGALPGRTEPATGRRHVPELAPFTCRFGDYHDPDDPARTRWEDRFQVRGTPRQPQFVLRFGNHWRSATLERHEALWPETIELHVSGPRDTITYIKLITDGRREFSPMLPDRGKTVSYFDAQGKSRARAEGSAFRIEMEVVGDGVLVRVTPPPSERANRKWIVSRYSTGW